MNGLQFEEFCRFFVARTLGMAVEDVRWVRMPCAVRPGAAPDTCQVDLFWETETPLGKYLTVAEAKWRDGHKVDRDDVLLLEQFRIGAGAHKAMLFSNAEFTEGVFTTAKRLGIAVHRLDPKFSERGMPLKDRAAIQEWLERRCMKRKELCRHEVKCKSRR